MQGSSISRVARFVRRLRLDMGSGNSGITDRWRSGTVAIEMAFVVPILVMFIASAIQFGSLFFLQNKMTDAARAAARALALGDASASEAQQVALGRLAGWAMSFTVQTQEPDPNDPADHDVIVEVTVPMSQATLVDILNLFGTGDMTASVTMRRE